MKQVINIIKNKLTQHCAKTVENRSKNLWNTIPNIQFGKHKQKTIKNNNKL